MVCPLNGSVVNVQWGKIFSCIKRIINGIRQKEN